MKVNTKCIVCNLLYTKLQLVANNILILKILINNPFLCRITVLFTYGHTKREKLMPITMNEIAEKLGVSIATVSRALSGRVDSASEETRRTVLEMAEKYGYQKRKTIGKSVAFIIDQELFNISGQFYTQIISGVEEELVKEKHYFHLTIVERDRFDLSKINLNFKDLVGVILVGVYHDDFVLKLKDIGVPMMLVDYFIPTEDLPAVLIDNADGIMKACKYLAEGGHTRVAYISGDDEETSTQERLYGYIRAVDLFGFDKDKSLVIKSGAGRIDSAFKAMEMILDTNSHPTAVVAYNDIIAIGAMEAIKQRGLSVPKDISIIGFDDIGLASEVLPPLTTMHVPKRTLGTVAVRKLFNLIKDKDNPVTKILLPTRLVIRKSTAKR